MIEYYIISHSMLIIHVNSTLKVHTSILKCIYDYLMILLILIFIYHHIDKY